MSRYFQETPQYINLGSGTTFGNGYTDRNVNLGTVPAYSQPMPYGYPTGGYYQPQPRSIPNPEFKKNPYGLSDDQMIEGGKIVGKNRGIGLVGAAQGLADAVLGTFGVETDFDKQGYGWGRGGTPHSKTGYGGKPTLGSVPQTIPNPNLPNPQMPGMHVPNTPYQGGPVPSTWKGQLGHYGTNLALGQIQNKVGLGQLSDAMDMAYGKQLRAMQDADNQAFIQSMRMQRTDKGKSERATEQQARATQGALANYYRRLGIAAMSEQAATKAIGGLARNQFGSTGAVSALGNWGV